MRDLMSVGKVVRGSLWLYISSLINNFIGYLYWIIATRFVESAIIGTSSAIMALSSLIASIFGLGISVGEMRMIGKSAGSNDYERISYYFTNALIISLLIFTAASILILFLPEGFMGYSRIEMIFASIFILMGLGSWNVIFSTFFTSLLKTEVIALSTSMSQIFKFIVGISLLYLGMELYGIIGGIIASILISDLVLIYMIRKISWLKIKGLNGNIIKEILMAGLPSYLPIILGTAGNYLGILTIYGILGKNITGTYYISFMIASFVYNISFTILGLMFPLLSGMEDGRKRATNRVIRISYVITMPIAALGIFYANVPLGFLGEEYLKSTLILRILLIGAFIIPITAGFGSLIYAYGKYSLATIHGISSNITRILLYFPLVQSLGDIGAAISYISGFISELLITIILSRRIRYRIEFNPLIAAIPISIGSIMYIFSMHWIIAAITILGASLFIYAKLGLLNKNDLKEIYEALFTRKYFLPYVRYIAHLLYGE